MIGLGLSLWYLMPLSTIFQLIEHEKKTEYMTLEIQVYYYREFEPRSCRGVLDTTLCDKFISDRSD
jgi:hypothetical protein